MEGIIQRFLTPIIIHSMKLGARYCDKRMTSGWGS